MRITIHVLLFVIAGCAFAWVPMAAVFSPGKKGDVWAS